MYVHVLFIVMTFNTNDTVLHACIDNDVDTVVNLIQRATISPIRLMMAIVTSVHDTWSVWEHVLPMVGNVNAIIKGKTLLMHCCSTPDPSLLEKIQRLVFAGCDLNKVVNGCTALSFLVKTNEVDTIKWCIAHGAAPQLGHLLVHVFNHVDESQSVMNEWLMDDFAERLAELGGGHCIPYLPYSNKPMLEFVLTLNLDVNEPDQNGVTPLIAACSEGIIDKIALLLRHGVNTEYELGYNSALNLQEAMEKHEEYERLQWLAVLQHMQPPEQSSLEDNQELTLAHLGTIHNMTLTHMLMPFL